jgi:thioredoxin-related protein
LLGCAGCSPAIWNAYGFRPEDVEKERGDKAVFVYFRHWAVPDCAKFEQNVLELPDVRTAMMSTYRVVLDYRVDQELAKRWSVTDTPGIALVGARGQLLTSHSGYVTREILLALIQRGNQEYAASKSAGAQAAGGP